MTARETCIRINSTCKAIEIAPGFASTISITLLVLLIPNSTVTRAITDNWRASVASETLTGVTQSKIGDVYLFIYLYDVRKPFLYFDPRVYVLVRLSTPSQTSLDRILSLSISTRITLEFELFTVLNSFTGAVKT